MQNPILTFKMGPNIVFCHKNQILTFQNRAEYRILTFKILFWHSKSGLISYFDIQNPDFTCEIGPNISYFDIQNPTLSFELLPNIVFWHSKSYFGIQNWAEVAFRHSKSYFQIRKWAEYRILTFKIIFGIRTEAEYRTLTFKILFWHSKSGRISYFDILKNVIFFKVCNWAAEGVRMTLEIISWSICRKIWDPREPRICSKTVWLATESTLGPTKMPVRLAMLMRKGIDIYFSMFSFNVHEVSYH